MFVATTAVCLVLLSSTTFVGAEANSLRGGHRSLISSDNNKNSYYAELIDNSRRLEGGGGGEGGEGGEGQGGEGQQGENKGEENGEKQEQQQQQYQEGNNEGQDQQKEENNNKNEQEGEQQEQQQEEEQEAEEANDDAAENYEEEVAEEEAADDDQSDFVTNVQDTVTSAQDTLSGLMDRFDEDVVNMWSTSPSEWNDELWKVFGVTAGIFTLLLSCLFYIFCLCCSDDREELDKDGANQRRWKKNHRGRLFTRMRNGDNETVASEYTNADRPFVLIEDVENNGADDKSRFGPSTVYAKSNDELPDAISPMSSKTGRTGWETRPASPRSRRPMADDKTEYTMKTRKSHHKNGVIAETVDVWSEFLGFKKQRSYNTEAFMKRQIAEGDDIDETDDEMTRRSKRRSSSKTSRNSKNSTNSRHMKTGTYMAPTQEETGSVPATSSNASDAERVSAPTPIMSNVIAKAEKNNSNRNTALVKTRNLLKSIGKSKNGKIGNSTSMESKEKSLASKSIASKGSKSSADKSEC